MAGHENEFSMAGHGSFMAGHIKIPWPAMKFTVAGHGIALFMAGHGFSVAGHGISVAGHEIIRGQ